MAHTVVDAWGSSLAVRVPDDVAQLAGLEVGEPVQIIARNGSIVIRALKKRPRPTIDELFRGRSPDEWREIYADAFDWGPDVGRERI